MSVYIQQDQHFDYQFIEGDFDIAHWLHDKNTVQLTGGRGASYKILIDEQPLVLRHYLRGGMVAALLNDRYLWTGLTGSRPFREQAVINHALQHQLPVPKVVAFMLQKRGIFYRAAIISHFIPNQGTLASLLYSQSLNNENWQQIGRLIRRMHVSGIEHVDLNANNILVDEALGFHLIDFDKANIKKSIDGWCTDNLQRLLRSLNKTQNQRELSSQPFHFSQQNWKALLQGYHEPDESIPYIAAK
jgi:3-deoxy-D-manno-octulosonic acid kinase